MLCAVGEGEGGVEGVAGEEGRMGGFLEEIGGGVRGEEAQ